MNRKEPLNMEYNSQKDELIIPEYGDMSVNDFIDQMYQIVGEWIVIVYDDYFFHLLFILISLKNSGLIIIKFYFSF